MVAASVDLAQARQGVAECRVRANCGAPGHECVTSSGKRAGATSE